MGCEILVTTELDGAGNQLDEEGDSKGGAWD